MNRDRFDQKNDEGFLTALLLALTENNKPYDDARSINVFKYDFIAEIFKIRVKNDEHRINDFENLLSNAMKRARSVILKKSLKKT